jgi:hypothetical protein
VISGGPVDAICRGRTVLIAWGSGALQAGLDAAKYPDRSAVTLLKIDPGAHGRHVLNRFGAFWPGRVRLPIMGLDSPTPLALALAEGPPIVWCGWDSADRSGDSVCWSDLRSLVRRFLASIPLAPSRVP